MTSEAAILSRVIGPEVPDLPQEAARAILRLRFPESDRQRMRELGEKAREGGLTEREEVELEGYRHVGHLLELLWSKARLSMKRAGADA